jgi:hypothetical protein
MIVLRTLSSRRLTRQVMRHPLRKHIADLFRLGATSNSPMVMRTPAAQLRTAERLCQGTCPGRSRYSYVPSYAAIQKNDWLTPQKERPVRFGWRLGRIVRAKAPRDYASRSGGGREDVGMAQSQARFHWDSVMLSHPNVYPICRRRQACP